MYPLGNWVDKCMNAYHQFLFKKSAMLWDVWCVDGDELHEISMKNTVLKYDGLALTSRRQ